MKKIIFIATVAQHILSFHLPYIQMLQDSGYEVHTACNGFVPQADKSFDLPIQRQPWKIKNIRAFISLCRLLKTERYDLISCHTPMGGVLARLAAFLAKTKPVLYMAHGFHFYSGGNALLCYVYKRIEKKLANITDALITINEEDYQAAQSFKLRDSGHVYFMNGIGVDISKIQNTRARLSKRSELGIRETDIVLVNVGELSARKNQTEALRALFLCKDKNIILLLCGEGKTEKYLKKLTHQLGLDDQVVFTGYRDDIYEILKISDIFVFTSRQEGLSCAVIEAMAAGLPVICSNIRGNNTLIHEQRGGCLYSLGDITALSTKIDLLAGQLMFREQFGAYNAKQAERYDIHITLKEMENIYNMFGL